MDRWTRLGIEAYRTGNREQARRFFRYALMESPNDISAWLWLVEVAENDGEKERCLTRVLALDPNHVLARRALEDLEARHAGKNMSYVQPFEQEANPSVEPPLHSSADTRSQPPFIEELAQQDSEAEIKPPLKDEPHAPAGRVQTWIGIALTLGALAALILLLAWLLHLF